MYRFEFICVGPTKTGTTWLSYVFRELGIDLPPAKEIKYFNEEEFQLKESGFFKRLIGRHWIFKANRGYLIGIIRNSLNRLRKLQDPCVGRIFWSLRFVFGVRSDDWYRSLFKDYGGIGDISPRYSELSPKLISEIDQRFPDLRILILVRNPIERDWSSAKMDLCKNKNRSIHNVSITEFLDYLSLPQVIAQSTYSEIIPKWQEVYGDRLKVVFYDDISFRPVELIQEILIHIGISNPEIDRLLIDKLDTFKVKIGKGIGGEMPEHVRKYLEKRHSYEISKLKETYPDIVWPSQW